MNVNDLTQVVAVLTNISLKLAAIEGTTDLTYGQSDSAKLITIAHRLIELENSVNQNVQTLTAIHGKFQEQNAILRHLDYQIRKQKEEYETKIAKMLIPSEN